MPLEFVGRGSVLPMQAVGLWDGCIPGSVPGLAAQSLLGSG